MRGHLAWELKYVSETPRPEGWARVRAGEGAGRAYLSSPIDRPPTFSDAKRGPARDGRGDEYGQRGGCGAVPAVPAAPREDRHEPDADGAKSEVIADKGLQGKSPPSRQRQNRPVPNLFKISQPVAKIPGPRTRTREVPYPPNSKRTQLSVTRTALSERTGEAMAVINKASHVQIETPAAW